jgi:hypothetical protein
METFHYSLLKKRGGHVSYFLNKSFQVAAILILEKLSSFNKKISKNCRKYYIVLLVSCKIRHTPAAPQPPLSRGELPGSSFSNRLFGGIPSREGGLLRRIDGGGGVC